ncbi:MAG: DUF2227 family putative metal-binding protein [Bacteroidales bacterium]
MPSGKIHSASSLVAFVASVAMPALLSTPNVPLEKSLIFGGGCLLGTLITPDLDISEGCFSMAVIRKIGGPMAERIWKVFWWPYGVLIPHRHWLSHLPVVSTSLRLGYLGIIAMTICLLLSLGGLFPAPDIKFSIEEIVESNSFLLFCGLCLSDTLHFVMDKTLPSI